MNLTPRPRRKIGIATLLLPALLALAACGGDGAESGDAAGAKPDAGAKGGQHRPGQPGQRPDNGGRPPLPTMAVSIEPAALGDISTYYSATASLDPDKQADILARVTGTVKRLLAEEGDRVRAGQELLLIDDAEYRHRFKQAEVALEQARLSFARTERVQAAGLVSTEELDVARTGLESAEAAWELASLELSYTRVKAPFPGRVVRRLVDLGQTVSNGTALFTLVDMTRLLARVHVPAREFRSIQTEQPVTLRVDSTGEELNGRIDLISPVVDPASGTIKVTVEITRYPPSTRPGDFAEVSIVTDQHAGVVVVPRTAVLTERDERIVYVAEEEVAHRRLVEVGIEDDDSSEILSGLEVGESVVVQGQRSLADGQPLHILDRMDLDSEEPLAARPADEPAKRRGKPGS